MNAVLNSDPVADFADAIRDAGLEPPEQVTADGKLHRFPTNGRRGDDSGWYILHDDGVPAGSFGDWRSGIKETWCAKVDWEFTPAERREYARRMERQRQEREAEEQRRQAEAAAKAERIWNEAQPGEHEYLNQKGIGAHGTRVHDGRLVVPMRDANGSLASLQRIGPDGGKRFLYGGKVTGCYYSIGKPLDGVLCIAEGFATAATIHEATGHAVAVAFNAGNLVPVARALREKFPEFRFIVCADNDSETEGNPGVTKGTEAAEAIGAYLAVPEFDGEGTDFNDLKQQRGAEAVRHCIEGSSVATQPKLAEVATLAAPEPLRRPVPPAAPYPMDALGGILGPAVKRIHAVVKAPDAVCAQSVLAAASLAVQSHADVVMDGRREPLSLWAVTVAESGERKSAVDDLALAAHREHERQALKSFADSREEYELSALAYETAKRSSAKGKTEAEVRNKLENMGPAPQEPLSPLLLVATPTIEGVHKLYKTGQPSLGLFHDDAGEFLGGHAMSKDNRTKSAAGMSRLWDRGEFDRVRGGDGAEKFYGKRLAMHLMMQPVIAETILSDDVLTGQGFLARSLLTWPGSTIGTREYAAVDLSTDADLARYRRRMTEILQAAPTLREGTRNELEPRTFSLTPDAKAAWVAIHDAIEADMGDGGEWSGVRAWAAKAPAQTLRIAGVLTLVDDPGAGVIQAETIGRACQIVLFALGEAARIVGTASAPPEIRHAEALLAWCHAERKRLLYSGLALQFGPGAIRHKPAFDAAMAELERAGWATRVDGGCIVDGSRRRRVWEVTEPPR